MYCKNCGNKLEEGARFCTFCGMDQQQGKVLEPSEPEKTIESPMDETVPEKKRAPKSKKKIIGILAVLAVILAAVIGVAVMFFLKDSKKGLYEKRAENYKRDFAYGNEDRSLVGGAVYDEQGNVVKEITLEQDQNNWWYRLDRAGSSFVWAEFGEDGSHNQKLHVFWGDQYQEYEVPDGIRTYKGCYSMNSVAYVAGGNLDFSGDEEHLGTLYLVKKGSAEPELIMDFACDNGYVLSPNGKNLLYLRKNNGTNELVLKTSKTERSISPSALMPLVVSDSGKQVYYLDNDGKLWVNLGTEEVQLSENPVNYEEESFAYVLFNRSLTEVIYQDGREVKYYQAGKEPQSIALFTGYMTPFFPEDLAYYFDDVEIPESSSIGRFTVYAYTLGFYNLERLLLTDWGSEDENLKIYQWDQERKEAVQVFEHADEDHGARWGVNNGYTQLIAAQGGTITVTDLETYETKTIYEGDPIVQWAHSADLKDIYILTEEGPLLYLDSEGQWVKNSTLIMEEDPSIAYLESAGGVQITADNELYFAKGEEITLLTVGRDTHFGTIPCSIFVDQTGSQPVFYSIGKDGVAREISLSQETK